MEEFYLDAILMPLSLFLVVGYHVYLWQCFKNRPWRTTMGIQSDGRRAWLELQLQGLGGDGVGKSMQVVQSLRNNLMIIIFRATISIAVSSSVAALTNNAYKASGQVLKSEQVVFGSQSSRVFALKYAAAFVVSVGSFLCSSFGVGFLVDTCILVTTANAGEVPLPCRPSSTAHIHRLVERGFALAFIGNRLMWVSFAVLLWPLGPIAVALCSLVLLWGFSAMDFVGKSVRTLHVVGLGSTLNLVLR